MGIKKFFSFVLLLSVGVYFSFGQTLTEIAKKERERRESLKGKKGIVVTNADLTKLKKKPAVEVPPTEPKPESEGEVPAESLLQTPPEMPSQAAEPAEAPEPRLDQATLRPLQERWEKAREYVELLTLKMGALWQEFSSLDNPSAKEAVRLAIAETFLKLQNAQEEEGKARQELEKFLGQIKKDSAPSLWIKQ